MGTIKVELGDCNSCDGGLEKSNHGDPKRVELGDGKAKPNILGSSRWGLKKEEPRPIRVEPRDPGVVKLGIIKR